MKFLCKLVLVLPCVTMIAASGCSAANVRVVPGPDGPNRAVVVDVDKHEAEQAAFEAAKSHCEDRGEETVLLATMWSTRATWTNPSENKFERGAAVGRSVTSGKDYETEVRLQFVIR